MTKKTSAGTVHIHIHHTAAGKKHTKRKLSGAAAVAHAMKTGRTHTGRRKKGSL